MVQFRRRRFGNKMEFMSKDISFQDYISTIQAYFKESRRFIESLFVNFYNKNNPLKGDRKSKSTLRQENRETRQDVRSFLKKLSCYKMFYVLKTDIKTERTSLGERFLEQKGFGFLKKTLTPIKYVTISINERIDEYPDPEPCEVPTLQTCSQCGVYYCRNVGRLCLWRGERNGELKVPGMTMANGDPIYLNANTYDEETVDQEIDRFVVYKKIVEGQLSRADKRTVEALRNSEAIRYSFAYLRLIHLEHRTRLIKYRSHLVYPLLYNKLMEE